MPQGFSGKDSSEVSVDAIRRGDVTIDDVRIHPDTLEHQATVAAEHGNAQLAANFRRAGELTRMTDEYVLSLYDALRPGRSTQEALLQFARDLEDGGAPLNAQLFRQAASVYERRGLTAQ
ncbi:MAG: diol dehydratase small subunit [Actinomycetes bacterium]